MLDVPFTSTWKSNFRSSFDVIHPAIEITRLSWKSEMRTCFKKTFSKLYGENKKISEGNHFDRYHQWFTGRGNVEKLVIPNLVRSNSSICLKIKIFFRFIIFNEWDTFTAFKYMIELLWIILNYFFETKMLLVFEFNCLFCKSEIIIQNRMPTKVKNIKFLDRKHISI